MKCKDCGCDIKPNMEKLKVIAGTTAAIAAIGAVTCTPIGWWALLGGASTPQVQYMIRLKMMAWKASDRAGGYFKCDGCGRDVGIGEFLSS